jgi:4-hydroxybenzoate polyprenyltransferase
MRPALHPYMFIIFFATLFEYNLHRLITIITKKEALKDDKHNWVNGNKGLFYFLVSVSVVGFCASIFLAKKEVLIALAPIAAITLLYTLPFIKNNQNVVRLRDVPGLKIFLIAFVWSAVTIFLPIIQSGYHYRVGHIVLIFLERFIFIFAITIPFDIRDMRADMNAGLKTIPILIGEKRSLTLAYFSISLFLLLCLIHYPRIDLYFLVPAFIISAISTLVFLQNKRTRQFALYHYAILDGTILIQGVLVCLSYYVLK